MNEFKEKVLGMGYREGSVLIGNVAKPYNRVMVGIPMTGLVRAEWVIARYGQVIPCNWSQTDAIQWLDQYTPIDFLVADARNIVAHHCILQEFDWLFFIDHDVILPPHTVLAMNERMLKGDIPIWSGLYFTKSKPSEPLVYRGRGTGYYPDWELGDKVWVDGLPMGCTMIHSSILREMATLSEEYEPKPGLVVKEIFRTPARTWFDAEACKWYSATGTEDLEFLAKVKDSDVLGKAGWDQYVDKEFPFMVDTSIFCRHIDNDGMQYPANGEEGELAPKEE